MKTLGARIAEKRKEQGLTQEALAERMGVSAQAVSKWENDISCPDITLLPALCKEFGCTTDELLTGSSDAVSMVPVGERKPFDELTLRIKVNSSDGDKVRVNLPMALVKWGVECGANFVPDTGTQDAMKNIDWNGLLKMVENGTIGKLVEIESADGDIVDIVVE